MTPMALQDKSAHCASPQAWPSGGPAAPRMSTWDPIKEKQAWEAETCLSPETHTHNEAARSGKRLVWAKVTTLIPMEPNAVMLTGAAPWTQDYGTTLTQGQGPMDTKFTATCLSPVEGSGPSEETRPPASSASSSPGTFGRVSPPPGSSQAWIPAPGPGSASDHNPPPGLASPQTWAQPSAKPLLRAPAASPVTSLERTPGLLSTLPGHPPLHPPHAKAVSRTPEPASGLEGFGFYSNGAGIVRPETMKLTPDAEILSPTGSPHPHVCHDNSPSCPGLGKACLAPRIPGRSMIGCSGHAMCPFLRLLPG
ncbi:cadherin-related family member 5 isoform X1 [Pan troglodytes]|uniref:cadherin-related family member 5 isoform X1 n=3 Tax=Pan troglodytes TaxID=9598 RepID=UPI0023F2D90A|nr:cadherin-related family member 5 isoform X1 [Pan troglodytes]